MKTVKRWASLNDSGKLIEGPLTGRLSVYKSRRKAAMDGKPIRVEIRPVKRKRKSA